MPSSTKFKDALALVNDTTLEKEVIIERLTQQLTSLDARILRSAWHTFQSDLAWDDLNRVGDMTLQQDVYPPFARLFMATVGSKNDARYKADQDVSSSLSIQHKEKKSEPTFQTKKVILKTDGAALMHNLGWDVLGMMELKNGMCDFNRAYRRDYDKCTLMTAISAVAMARCIKAKAKDLAKDLAEEYDRVAIPFFIASGGTCSLFATTLDQSGNPCIKVVGYPDGYNALDQTYTTSSCQARKEIFIALAVLLNQCKSLFDEYET